MNRRALSLILIITLCLSAALTACSGEVDTHRTEPLPLPALQSENPTPWADPDRPAKPTGPEPWTLPSEEVPSYFIPTQTDSWEPGVPSFSAESPEDVTIPAQQTDPAEGAPIPASTELATEPLFTDPDNTEPELGTTPDPQPTEPRAAESPEDIAAPPEEPPEELPCALQEELEERLKGLDGTWSLYLKNLDTRETVSIREEPMVAASLIKLFVAGAAFATDPEAENADRCRLVRSMISSSSNEACNQLIDQLGKANINDFITARGFEDSELNRKMLEQSPLENYTSTRECGAVLEAILQEEYVSPAASRLLLQDLKDQERTWKLPAGVPNGVETANKTGELLTVENDVCIVWSPGGTYILCIMASDLPNTAAAREQFVSISRRVYQFFSERDPNRKP